MSSDEGWVAGFAGLKLRVSDAIPAGEVWLASGCGWRKEHPELPHGQPEWRVAGMCVHEHLDRRVLCSGCKEVLEGWYRTGRVCCIPCGRRLPQGRHYCLLTLEFSPLDSGAD
jgi:hypothetical protein